MFRTTTAAVVALILFAGSARAETPVCDAKKLASQVDRYATQPFSVLNYRVLSGLGDPGVEASDTFDDSWASRDAYMALAKSVIPSAEQAELGYDCRASYPLSVLKGHIAKFGVSDPYVVQWVKAQAQVFDACTRADGVAPSLIDPVMGIDATREEAQRFDRAYQNASIAFYRDKTKAIDLFRQIAASSSPHKAAARYNIANILANAKQVDAARKEATAILADPSLTSVHTITKQLLGYIANLEDTANGWSSLINEALATVTKPTAAVLASPDHKTEFARALSDLDYAGIRAKDSDWWIEGSLPENPTISKAIVDASRSSPLALWVMGGQSIYEKQQNLPWILRGKLWQESASGYVSKVLAVAPAGQQMSALPKAVFESLSQDATEQSRSAFWAVLQQQLEAAASSCGSAPETAALAITAEQAFRAAAVQGHFDDIYAAMAKPQLRSTELLANRLLPQVTAFLLGTGNVEEGRRMRDTLLTSEFIASFPEQSRAQAKGTIASFLAWIAEDKAHWLSAVRMQSQPMAAPLQNYLTTPELWQQADDSNNTAEQRALFARVAWTRDYALKGSTKPEFLDKMLAANPVIKASSEQLTKDYPKLKDQQQQLLLVLRNPRLSIMVNAPGLWATDSLELGTDSSYIDVGEGDHNDRNWWCPLELDRHLGNLRSAYDMDAQMPDVDPSAAVQLVDPNLKTEADKAREKTLAAHPVITAANWKSLQQLSEMPSAPKKLTLAATAWAARSKPADGAAEALALAVRSTRYGCNWHGGHGAYSKKAQQLLQKKFSDSSFAAATPYWFDCMDNVWDDKGNRTTSCKPHEWPRQVIPGRKTK